MAPYNNGVPYEPANFNKLVISSEKNCPNSIDTPIVATTACTEKTESLLLLPPSVVATTTLESVVFLLLSFFVPLVVVLVLAVLKNKAPWCPPPRRQLTHSVLWLVIQHCNSVQLPMLTLQGFVPNHARGSIFQ